MLTLWNGGFPIFVKGFSCVEYFKFANMYSKLVTERHMIKDEITDV
jgi:hypothetical protein